MFSETRLCPPAQPWRRHELLRIAPDAWSQALASRPDLAMLPYLAGWANYGWPVIVRRRWPGERADLAPVGVPLPPSVGKRRISLTIPPQAVLERSPPPSLWTVRRAASASWRRAIDELVALAARYASTLRVIGGLLWEYRTGLRYLSTQSDLDVLWRAPSGSGLCFLLARVEAIERAAGPRIDGEVIFPDGGAVNWRELHLALSGRGPAEVLVKSMDGARQMSVSELLTFRSAA